MGETPAGERWVGDRDAERPWPDDAPLFASGTDALAALLRWGAARHGWSRVWLPSYYCPEVPAALRAFIAGVAVLAYPDSDLWALPEPAAAPLAAGDIVVVANQLGVRRPPAADRFAQAGVVIVEDHSHDLGSAWAFGSAADYAFASLRKTLPIPDGGVVWSPRGLVLPPEPVAARGGPAAHRLASAIAAQGRHPTTAPREGLRLRALARAAAAMPGASGEREPGSPERPGISPVSRALLPQMPARAWRERRRANLETLDDAIGEPDNALVLRAPEGGVAFAFTLVLDAPERRDQVRQGLAARAVVSTVLWPLDPTCDPGAQEADADLSRRILSIHADQRFDREDMLVLGGILHDALRSG